MKAVLWKELRENAPWTILGLVANIALIATWRWLELFGRVEIYESIVTDEFFLVPLLLAPAFGFCLGLVQTIPELSADRWAFLIQRSVSQTRIFAAKVVAGLLLYSIVILVPLLAVGVWRGFPALQPSSGAIRPFHWLLVVPCICLALAGSGIYFAAMLMFLCRSRWYGSRLLPLLMPIFTFVSVVFYVANISEIPSVGYLLVIVASTVVMGNAALDSFLRFGDFRSRTAVGLASHYVCLLFATVVIVLLVSLVPLATWVQLSGSRKPYVRPAHTSYRVDVQGRVWRVSYGESGWDESPPIDRVVNLTDESASQSGSDYEAAWTELLMHSFPSRLGIGPGGSAKIFRRVPVARRQIGELLYSTPDGLLLGFNRNTNDRGRLVTKHSWWISPNGFFPPEKKPSRGFGQLLNVRWRELADASDSSDVSVLVFTDGVYAIDFPNRLVTPLYTPPKGESIQRLSTIGRDNHVELAIEMRDSVILFVISSPEMDNRRTRDDSLAARLLNMSQVDEIPIPSNAGSLGSFRLGTLEEGKRYLFQFDHGLSTLDVTSFVTIDRSGRVLKREQYPTDIEVFRGPYAHAVVASLPPLLILSAATVDELRQMATGAERGLVARTFRRSPAHVICLLGIMLAVSLVSGLLSAVVGRRLWLSGRRRKIWIVTNILLGLPGLLLMLCLHRRPPLWTCPNCHRRQPAALFHCGHCGEPSVADSLGSIAVFDDMSTTASRPRYACSQDDSSNERTVS